MIPRTHLTRLRNEIPLGVVLQNLGVPSKFSEGYLRFLCPACSEFNTAVNPRTNLGRCFRCKENYNAIDLAIRVEDLPFVEAVRRVAAMLAEP